MTMMTTMTMTAIHWSCGQYTPATTGARLKPMSSTTAPVTTGGSTFTRMPAPRKWMRTPTSASTTPATRMAPVTCCGVPPCAVTAATPPTNAAEVPR